MVYIHKVMKVAYVSLTILIHLCGGTLDLNITEAQYGTTTTLTCTSSSIKEGDPYIWYKSKSTIYDNNHTGLLVSDKYIGTSRDGMLVLYILNTKETDSGSYECNHNFIDSNPVELAISCTLDLNITEAQYGTTTTLTCTSSSIKEGDPYIWYKSKSTIYDNNHTGLLVSDKYIGTSRDGMLVLYILNTKETDSGSYECNHNFIDSNPVELAISSPSASTCTSGNTLTIGQTIGIAIGSLGFAAVVAFIVWCVYRMTSSSSGRTSNRTSPSTDDTGDRETSQGTLNATNREHMGIKTVAMSTLRTGTPERQELNQPTPQTPERQGPNQSTHQTPERQQPTPQTLERQKPNQPTPQTLERQKPNQSTPQTLERQKPNQPTPQTLERQKPDQPTPQTPERQEPNQPTPQTLECQEPNQPIPKTLERQEPNEPSPQTLERQEPNQPTPQTPECQEDDQPTPQTLEREEPNQSTPQTLERQEPNQPTSQTLEREEPNQSTPQTLERQEHDQPTPQTLECQEPNQPTPQTLERQEPNQPTPQTLERQEDDQSHWTVSNTGDRKDNKSRKRKRKRKKTNTDKELKQET